MADDGDKEQWTNKRVDKFVVVNQKLGEGAFGKVYRGFFADDESNLVAAKAIPIKDISNSNKMLELIKREISILQKIKNKYIVKLYDVARTNHNLYLFFEYCSDGDLKKYLEKKEGRRLSENEAVLFMRHLCEGFRTLHQENIIHRDIKPANILLHQGVAKISDFGFARQIDTGMNQPNFWSRLGSPLYMGPQILDNKQFSSKCDVWSVGIVFYEMLYGRTPWSGDNQVKLLSNIKNCKLELPENPKRSDQVKDLLYKMLVYEEDQRYSWEEVFKHPLIAGGTSPTASTVDFSDPVAQNQQYVKHNLVAGYLQKEIEQPQNSNSTTNSSAKSEDSQESKGQIKNRTSFLDTSKATLVILEQSKLRSKILKINELVLYQRNIGFFFNYVTVQLVRDKKNGSSPLESHLYQRLLYVTSKNQLIEQEQTRRFIHQDTNPDIKDWAAYKQSLECQNTLRIIEKDCDQSKKFFLDISKQASEEIKSLKTKPTYPQLKPKIDKFEKVMDNNFNRNEQPLFKEVYKETLNEYLDIIKPDIKAKKLNKNALQFIRYIIICLNPYEVFKPEQYQSFDFNLFYEEMDGHSEDDIFKYLFQQLKL